MSTPRLGTEFSGALITDRSNQAKNTLKLENSLEKIDETLVHNYSSNKLVKKLQETGFNETMENVLGIGGSSSKKPDTRPRTELDILDFDGPLDDRLDRRDLPRNILDSTDVVNFSDPFEDESTIKRFNQSN